jgi:tol-pal system protein YbgF
MKSKFCFCLLTALLTALPSAQAGTKEELMRLQNDVLALQNQIREFEKTFSEKIDGLKSLVVQLKDEAANSGIVLKQVSAILENQSSGVRSADQAVLQEIQALSTKIDDSATRISALAQQISELKVHYKSLSEAEAPEANLAPDALYNQALRDFLQENYDLAIQGFTAYAGNYPGGDKAAAALLYVGEAYRRQNQLPQAVSALTRVINDYPGTDSIASALYKRALAELAMQEKQNAIADFRAVIEEYPTTSEAAQAKIELQKIGVKPTQPAKPAPRKSR